MIYTHQISKPSDTATIHLISSNFCYLYFQHQFIPNFFCLSLFSITCLSSVMTASQDFLVEWRVKPIFMLLVQLFLSTTATSHIFQILTPRPLSLVQEEEFLSYYQYFKTLTEMINFCYKVYRLIKSSKFLYGIYLLTPYWFLIRMFYFKEWTLFLNKTTFKSIGFL